MSADLLEPVSKALPLQNGEEVLLAYASDLTSDGRFGETTFAASRLRAFRLSSDGASESWDLTGLSSFRFEELVDAGALVADMGGSRVELLRGSAAHSAHLVVIAKQMEQLRTGADVDAELEARRICPKCHRPLPRDSNLCEYCINRGRTLVRLFGFVKPYWKRVAFSASLLLLGTALSLAPGFLLKILVDDVFDNKDTRLFVPVILAMIGAALVGMGVSMVRGWTNAWISNKVTVDIRARLFAHLQALSLAFFDRRTVGSVMSRVTNDTGSLYEVLVDGIPLLLRDGLILIAIPIVLLSVNWHVALWTLMPIPVILYLVKVFRTRIMRVWRRFWHSWSRLSGALNGVLSGMRVVKAFEGEDRESARFRKRVQNLADLGYTAETAWAIFFPMILFLVSGGTIVAYYIAGKNVLAEEMTKGEFFLFVTFLTQMQTPMQTLSRLIDWTSRALTASERVFEVLDTVPDIQQPKSAVVLNGYRGEIEFDNVRFGYEKAHEVLHGIDLSVKPGEMIGIVGPSGSGKSTLMNLLMRFYDPTEGRILLDGHDLRDLDLHEFRQNVGVVPQESFLFPGTIHGNIAYGRPDASREEIMAAAKAANSHDFIMHFPDGYDSYVGERGQRLSGGERQRISIARAILHNPKILILDEATSSVDTETERMIQEALNNLVEGRTVFAIAHRLSTLRHANRIIVLEEGKIVEMGSHDELMELGGVYHKLVTLQTEMAKVRAEFIDFDGSGEED